MVLMLSTPSPLIPLFPSFYPAFFSFLPFVTHPLLKGHTQEALFYFLTLQSPSLSLLSLPMAPCFCNSAQL